MRRLVDLRYCLRLVDLHQIAVGHAAHRVVRAGDDLVARPSGPTSTSKYLSPAMPILIGTNSAVSVAHDEHAFGFLARLARLRARRRRRPARSRRRRLVRRAAASTICPLRVVDQLAHGHGRNRHGRRRSSASAVVMSAVQVKPGRTSGTCSSSTTTTLKFVACVVPCAAVPVALNRAVADLGDVALERPVGNRVDRDLRLLAELHVRDVGLVDLDLGLDHRHVGQRQQHRAGVVHRADDGRFAFLDVAARDDAVDRRFDADLAEIVARALERRRAPDRCGSPARRPACSRSCSADSADFDVVLGLLERLARRQLLAPEILLALRGSAAPARAARARSRPPAAI